MAWLSGYNKRIKVTADHTKVDSNLSWFPLTIFLKSGDGDTTKIFDELGSNNLKMAITKSDGTTQLYVEIEQWDTTNKVGVLHCGRDGDTLSSSADTDYYIYYDSSHADNTDYVGVKNSTPAQSVWDSNFKAIYHMSDGADTSHIYDSTSNNNDGTKKAINEPIQADGQIAKAQSFDGSNDYIGVSSPTGIPSGNSPYTIEAWIKPDAYGSKGIVGWGNWGTTNQCNAFRLTDDGLVNYWWANDLFVTVSGLTDGGYHYVLALFDGTTRAIYVDNVSKGSDTPTGHNAVVSNFRIGSTYNGEYFDGIQDEVRISNVARSSAWIKASYNSLNNSLLTYGAEETNANFFPFF